MNGSTVRGVFLGHEPELMAQVRNISCLDRGRGMDWTFLTTDDLPSVEELTADVLVVDERLWREQSLPQLKGLRERTGNTPILFLCSPQTACLAPNSLAAESIQLVDRADAANLLPSALSALGGREPEPPSQRRQILIIDDSYDDRELYARALRRVTQTTYTAVEAADGTRGIELLQRMNPDCILLDYSLPGRNGLEVLRNIRAEWPEIPVVILTGQGNEAIAVEAMKNGAQDYVIKSQIDDEMLHRVIKSACETHALQRRIVQQRDTLALFTRALAHDLKEPLRTICSYVDIVRDSGQLSKRHHNFLGTVRSAAAHMERLVGMVTHYARLEAEDISTERELCDANDLLQQALKNLSQHASEVNNEIVVDQLPALYGNAVQLTNVFQNLLSNALNYGDKPTTRIKVTHKAQELHHLFTIEDNGSGIDPRHFKLLFQPFKRLSTGLRRGSGLGLALCKRIVEAHSGRIWLESELGQGTKVHFTLPAFTTPQVLSPGAPQALPSSGPAGPRPERELANVLLVEDNEADVVLTQILLQETDGLLFNVYSVANGELALRWLSDAEKPRIDLILLDINMPVMDGFTFLHNLRQDGGHARIPVIMCSTSEEQNDLSRAEQLGVTAYVTKPVRLHQLEVPLRSVGTLVVNRDHGTLRLERRDNLKDT